MFKAIATFIVMVVLSGYGIAQPLRYNDEAGYQRFDFDDSVSYQDYQAAVAKVLRDNWTELLANDPAYRGLDAAMVDELVAAHRPTDRPARGCRPGEKKKSMLLIHGLYGSPRSLRDIETYFNEHCFHTRSLLLPGHGTRPGSLLHSRWQEWRKAVNYAADKLAQEGDGNIYLTGYSTGGALALQKALDDPGRVKGLFLFAPALKVEDGLAGFLANFMDWVPYQKMADSDLIQYESITLNSVIQVGRLADAVTARLEQRDVKLAIPVMIVVAGNDVTVKAATALDLYRRGRFGDNSEMLVYTPLTKEGVCVKTSQAGDPSAKPKVPAYVSSCFIHRENGREYMIADYSHMSLTLSSADPHYGLEGSYRYCSQYFLGHDAELKQRCKETPSDQVCFGERRAIGSRHYAQCTETHRVVRRLTSNPRFDELTMQMTRFMARFAADFQ